MLQVFQRVGERRLDPVHPFAAACLQRHVVELAVD